MSETIIKYTIQQKADSSGTMVDIYPKTIADAIIQSTDKLFLTDEEYNKLSSSNLESNAEVNNLEHVKITGDSSDLTIKNKNVVMDNFATIGTDNFIPRSQLPDSFVDEIIVYESLDKLKSSGITNSSVILVDAASNKMYRYSASGFVEISPQLTLGTNIGNAYPGDKGQIDANNLQTLSTSINTLSNSINSIKSTADALNTKYNNLKTSIPSGATIIANNFTKLSSAINIKLTGDVNGTISFDGSTTPVSTNLSLVEQKGIATPGTYTSIKVGANGFVTGIANYIEYGNETKTSPSNLREGGIFFKYEGTI